MILSDKKIRDRILNYQKYGMKKPLIEDYKEENLQGASYDISIKNTVLKFVNEFKYIKLDDKNAIDRIYEEIDLTYGYDLRPHEYILVILEEFINMPKDLTAHIRPRTTFTKLGLIVSHQHLNPTYCGRLTIGLYNSTPFVIKLPANIKIGQLVFEKLTEIPSVDKLYENKKDAKYQNEDGFVGSKIYDEFEAEVDKEYGKLLKKLFNEKEG